MRRGWGRSGGEGRSGKPKLFISDDASSAEGDLTASCVAVGAGRKWSGPSGQTLKVRGSPAERSSFVSANTSFQICIFTRLRKRHS